MKKPMTVSLPEDLDARVRELATRQGSGLSDWVARAIADAYWRDVYAQAAAELPPRTPGDDDDLARRRAAVRADIAAAGQ